MPIFKGPKASVILSDGGKREGIGILGPIKGSKPKAKKNARKRSRKRATRR